MVKYNICVMAGTDQEQSRCIGEDFLTIDQKKKLIPNQPGCIYSLSYFLSKKKEDSLIYLLFIKWASGHDW